MMQKYISCEKSLVLEKDKNITTTRIYTNFQEDKISSAFLRAKHVGKKRKSLIFENVYLSRSNIVFHLDREARWYSTKINANLKKLRIYRRYDIRAQKM